MLRLRQLYYYISLFRRQIFFCKFESLSRQRALVNFWYKNLRALCLLNDSYSKCQLKHLLCTEVSAEVSAKVSTEMSVKLTIEAHARSLSTNSQMFRLMEWNSWLLWWWWDVTFVSRVTLMTDLLFLAGKASFNLNVTQKMRWTRTAVRCQNKTENELFTLIGNVVKVR